MLFVCASRAQQPVANISCGDRVRGSNRVEDGGTSPRAFVGDRPPDGDLTYKFGQGPIIYYLLQFDGNTITDVNITTCFPETNYPTWVAVWDSAVLPVNLTHDDIVLIGSTADCITRRSGIFLPLSPGDFASIAVHSQNSDEQGDFHLCIDCGFGCELGGVAGGGGLAGGGGTPNVARRPLNRLHLISVATAVAVAAVSLLDTKAF